MFVRTAFCSLMFIAAPAHADEIADRVCPLLEKIASGAAGKADYAIQAELIMAIGAAYDFDGEALKALLTNIDASTTQSCPGAKDTILKGVAMQSLEQALR